MFYWVFPSQFHLIAHCVSLPSLDGCSTLRRSCNSLLNNLTPYKFLSLLSYIKKFRFHYLETIEIKNAHNEDILQ
jgi:hypothetical protein